MFASIENYRAWKDHPNINWLSIAPSDQHLNERKKILREEYKNHGLLMPPELAMDEPTTGASTDKDKPGSY